MGIANGRLRCAGTIVLAVAAICFATVAAMADDDGGSDRSGGPGGSESGGTDRGVGDRESSPWPYGRSRSRSIARSCRGGFLFWGCSTRARRTATRSRSRAAPRAAARGVPQTVARAAPRPAARAQLVVVGLSPEQVAQLSGRGFALNGQRTSNLLGATTVRLIAPSGLSASAALRAVTNAAPGALVAPNTRYRRLRQSFRPAGEACGDRCEPFELAAWKPANPTCIRRVAIGVVDTGVDMDHPALTGTGIVTHDVTNASRVKTDLEHGTGVVSLIAGAPGSTVGGLAAGARVFAVNAFRQVNGSSSADAYDLVAALDWLTEQSVHVVNLSLTGADNAVVKRAVDAVMTRGTKIVAATGRPDSSASYGYPARYDGVVAVASIDARLRASRLSARGQHVRFAAPGVGLIVAGTGGKLQRVDGTSFAAPFVTAAFARGLASGVTVTDLETHFAASAKDLGAPGRDPVFGWGLIQFPPPEACR